MALKRVQLWFAPWMALCAVAAAASESQRLQACVLPGLDEPARCGELSVPENPGRPDGRRITIGFAVVPATGANALADPIVPLHGGPGEDVIDDAGELAGRFAALRAERDLLLIDQRGTGRSSALPCHLHDPGNAAPNLRHFLPPAAVEACERELSSHADLTQYSLLNFAHDLEAVRKALGYDRYNLVAGSYGTRAAQVFMRAYPASARTALLNGAVPMDFVTPLTMARASQEAFEATFTACEQDPACSAAYPRLRADFAAVLARLDAGDVRVEVPGSAAAPLGRGRVVEWLRARLYRPRTGAELPWLIHRAARGDYSPIVGGILAHARNIDTAFDLGIWFSITCSEDIQFLREEDIAPATSGTFLGDYRVREQQAACRGWPMADLPAGYRERLRTDIPTMFVSGDMDAVTPLWFTANVTPGFPNRVEVLLSGHGHTEWTDCVGGLYRRFVESGRAQGIEAACPATPRPPFRI
jgi:pimeloyl-ACP methyl ester carboxylesterase